MLIQVPVAAITVGVGRLTIGIHASRVALVEAASIVRLVIAHSAIRELLCDVVELARRLTISVEHVGGSIGVGHVVTILGVHLDGEVLPW